MEENQKDRSLSLALWKTHYYLSNGRNTRPYKVLHRIFEHACSLDKSNLEGASLVFSWQDLIQDPDDEAWIKDNLKKAVEEKWPLHFDDLNQTAFDEEIAYYPIIELHQKGGGAGNVTTYCIKFVRVRSEAAVHKQDLPHGYIGYSLETSDTKNPIIRFVDGLTAKGIKLHLMVGTMVTGVVLGVLTLIIGLYLITSQTSTFGLLNTTIDIAIIVSAIYMTFSPIYRCITERIILAPTILSPSDHYSTQLEYTSTEESRKDGSPIRQFRIVSYVGECSICGGRVDVEKGRGLMAGRLVGRCSNSPVEHQYTFDHQTKIGKLIHEEYFDIQTR